ncbi:MT-A70-domain-containing protein [Pisolithus microcarpus]|nr:MT-A70-domain-containing protein [Pisolithus microcarpus]
MAEDDELASVVSSGILSAPISSWDLLLHFISLKAGAGSPTLRLTDLRRLDTILERLENHWEYGTIRTNRDDDALTVVDRAVDEEADSAAGDEHDECSSRRPQLGSLGKELKEVYALLQRSTAKGRLLAERFRSVHSTFNPICPQVTKDECSKVRREASGGSEATQTTCDRVHFRPLIRLHTDPSLGHCSYLNTCYSEPTYAQSPSIPPFPSGSATRGKEKAPCRYLHFEVDWDERDGPAIGSDHTTEVMKVDRPFKLEIGLGPNKKDAQVLPPQWINCDLRHFDYSVLGKFHVIMADPPWDIHMSGLLFLWVTGRAMEVGTRIGLTKVVWVKTNQLQRVIRTGRTGHWLNHTKEHMLVGVKTHLDDVGNLKFPSWVNRGLDTDVIVSEVRETSRKPDEVYGLIERIITTRPGWLTLGNQLGPDQIFEEDLAARIRARYPERLVGGPTAGALQP